MKRILVADDIPIQIYWYIGPRGGTRLVINADGELYEWNPMVKTLPQHIIDEMKLGCEFIIPKGELGRM